jgi:hypothetical protein
MLTSYLSLYCHGEEKSSVRDKWLNFKAETDFIVEQLDELKLCLKVDNNIYKFLVGIL